MVETRDLSKRHGERIVAVDRLTMRVIRRLGRGQRTVLLSSHLMSRVEQICDRVGVINGCSAPRDVV